MILYFILGALFVLVALPLLDALTMLAATAIEALKAKLSVKIAKYNCEINKMDETVEEKTPAIGFVYPEDYTYEEEEDE